MITTMKKILYFAVFACVALTSCKDFLDAENKTSGGVTADDFLGANPSAMLTTAYNSLYKVAYLPGLNSQGTDLYMNIRNVAAGEYNQYSMTPGSSEIQSFYANCYALIQNANGVLEFGSSTSKEGAEARFLRNYAYYLLTQHFGGVPYITEYIKSAEQNYPRTDVGTIYNKMIGDLTDLYNNSPLDAQDHTGRASKQAVAALLAKVCLAAGWDLNTTLNDAATGSYTVNNTAMFAQAAAWAETAINGIALTMPFADKWSPTNEGNAEEIFSVQYERNGYPGDVTEGGHSMQNNFGGYYGECTATGVKNVNSNNAQSKKSIKLFEKGDQRYEATFMTTIYNSVEAGGTAKWGADGGYYLAYKGSNLNTKPIALRFYPYYYTAAEVTADLAAHQSQYVMGSGTVEPIAAIIGNATDEKVTRYKFNADGSAKAAESVALDSYYSQVNAGVCVKKFDDANSEQYRDKNDYRDIVLFHVSDMYLVAAEAYLMAGQTPQALQKVNDVRARAGLAALGSFGAYAPQYTTSASFTIKDLDVILDERARELYAEGHRWMDLRRTKQLVRYNVEFNESIHSVADMSNNRGEIKWLRPIPENEISANTGISVADQNPGY